MGGFFSSLFHHKSTEVAQPIQNIGAGNLTIGAGNLTVGAGNLTIGAGNLKIGDIRNNKNNAVFKIGSG